MSYADQIQIQIIECVLKDINKELTGIRKSLEIVAKMTTTQEKNMNIKVKKLRKDATIPTRGSAGSAGYDIYAARSYEFDGNAYAIPPHETVKIPTGLAFELPDGCFAGLVARSGLATKEGLRPANCVAVCDADYRGEYMVPIHNDSYEWRHIKPGDRIAQMILLPCQSLIFEEVDELSETERGEGGFGSTGNRKDKLIFRPKTITSSVRLKSTYNSKKNIKEK